MGVTGNTFFLFEDNEHRWVKSDYITDELCKAEIFPHEKSLYELLYYAKIGFSKYDALDIAALNLLNDWAREFGPKELQADQLADDPLSPFWTDEAHCWPPLEVSAAADRLIKAVESGHPLALKFMSNYPGKPRLGEVEWRKEFFEQLIYLRDACASAAAKGCRLVSHCVLG